MPPEHTVRPATAADADAIRRVAREAWHAAYDDLLGPDTVTETVAEWYDPDRLVEHDITADERPLFVAVDDALVGFAEAAPETADRARLYRIYVTPDRWGEGIGSELLSRVESALRERGFDRLTLEVLAENSVGVEFYESRGFRRTATTHDQRFDVDEYEYRKRL